MFTGIVQDVGRVVRCEELAAGRRLRVATALPAESFEMGESVAIAGACMTVVETGPGEFAVDVSAESLRRTTLGDFREGHPVNLERAMRLGDRVGGHMVSGHVDGTGSVVSIRPEGESSIYTFRVPSDLASMLVEKGSVAVDGISLTCFRCEGDEFDVAVIPHTQAVTTLGKARPGDRVNLEVDAMGKYVAKLVDKLVEKAVDAALASRLAK